MDDEHFRDDGQLICCPYCGSADVSVEQYEISSIGAPMRTAVVFCRSPNCTTERGRTSVVEV